jgi:hypothetical protein
MRAFLSPNWTEKACRMKLVIRLLAQRALEVGRIEVPGWDKKARSHPQRSASGQESNLCCR